MSVEDLLAVIEKGGLVYQNSYDMGNESYLSAQKFLCEFATHFKLSQPLKGNYRVTNRPFGGKMKIKGYVREGYTQTVGDRISFADATTDGKKTIYFEIIVKDKKESVIYVLDSYVEATRLALSLLQKTTELLMATEK